MTNFHVGQKVVLVDAERRNNGGITREQALSLGASYPVKGEVYTVREIFVSCISRVSALLLEELRNENVGVILGMKREPGFDADRFKPVVERKTDISIFTDMLNTQRVRTPA